MANPNDSNNDKNTENVDSSSFASILAGVKRMRDEHGGDFSENDITIQRKPQQQKPSPPTASSPVKPITNNITTARKVLETQRATLEKPTAKPVSPVPQQPKQSSPPPRLSSSNVSNQIRPGRLPQQPRSSGLSDILVHKSQEKNPLLSESMMKTTPWVFDGSILSDYYISPTFQILFLSLKYHKLRPEYIWTRLKRLNKGSTIIENRKDNNLRVLLVVVDIDSHQEVLRKLSDFCIKHDLSLVLAWSFEEAGNYIALGKHLDNAPHQAKQSIRGFKGADYSSNVVEAFTGIKSVNKTDVSNLLANYKSVKEMVLQCSKHDNEMLGNIPGMGAVKRRNLKQVFSEPFILNKVPKE
ncbi:Rad10 protein [Candida orthopsilosis Co 90-125]|uniref:Rad10 protein n=1 Tax=Candida orthopsilosis (strain 90-125) TaxID=1136231 RepID=H8X068_CANO9|nr:Rad10 protein [Candida orthopsilosis Co 90-125]CCG22580.1 Rad10 protein [Candida orthopsilosis Co 90-125]